MQDTTRYIVTEKIESRENRYECDNVRIYYNMSFSIVQRRYFIHIQNRAAVISKHCTLIVKRYNEENAEKRLELSSVHPIYQPFMSDVSNVPTIHR